ncbi:hypothetical protein [Flavobacterium sp. LAR06]|uniref:hypothetical protein n=1 Tax=Flavobacterium sp. LAR06 TaxID=3064897 RepID=UPI0035C21EF5
MMEFLVLLLFFDVFFLERKKIYRFPSLWYLSGFIFVSISSCVLNNLEVIQLLLFFREYLPAIVFFYIIINTTFSIRQVSLLTKLIVYLYVSQIFAGLIKVVVLGSIAEEFIGTISNRGGSITTIIALLGGSYCISGYFITSKIKYLWGALGFIFFSLTGGKRATIAYFPLIYIVSLYFLMIKFKKEGINVGRKLLVAVVSICILFYVSARVIPSLNPENKIWGTFDFTYVIEYSQEYNSGGFVQENIGRAEAPGYVVKLLLSGEEYNALFGFGAGHLVKSGFNIDVRDKTTDEITESLYGVGYGARTGFLQMLLQIGFLGLFFYTSIFINLFRIVVQHKKKANDGRNKHFYLLSLLILIIVLIDYYTYSFETSILGAISISYMWFLGIVFRNKLDGVQLYDFNRY